MSEHSDASPVAPSPYRSAPGTPKRESTALPDHLSAGKSNQRPLERLVMLNPVIAPIDPPRRRSSLAFSQLCTGTPVQSAAEEDAHTPNVGRKRTHAAPLMRPAATPGHTSRIQQIFHDATAMMQLDVAYASSPAGSIDSRISPLSATTPGRALPPTSPDIMNWRYSSAPQRLAEADSDVREPFPAIEPPSSGYLPPLPDSSSPAGTELPRSQRTSQLSDFSIDTNMHQATSTELAWPLSELHVNHTAPSSYQDSATLDGPPDPISEPTTDLDIFCSPVAKAAADSAKVKRGLNSPTHIHSKENIDHVSRCPDPSVHQIIAQSNVQVPGPPCPDPSVHRGTPQSNTLAIPRQLPYRRANSRGSPLPPSKARYSFPHNNHRSSPPRNGYETLPPPSRPLLKPYFTSPPPAEHFQPGWSNFPTPDASPGAYSFSTAAAKITGSSAAPDSRIRDSYRTDTLTPLAKPQARYRKTGIAAMTRGAGRFYGAQGALPRIPVQFGSSPPRGAQGIPKKRVREGEPRSLDDVVMEENEEVVKELSPNITPYRKGFEPKRARRVSYWDKDILGPENKENGRLEDVVDAGSPKEANEESEMWMDKDDD